MSPSQMSPEPKPESKPRPNRFQGFKIDATEGHLLAALVDVFRYLNRSGVRERFIAISDALDTNSDFVNRTYSAVLKKAAHQRQGTPASATIYADVASKIWVEDLPACGEKAHFRFYPGEGNKYAWRALKLIQIPEVSKYRGVNGEYFLAIDYLDIYDRSPSSASLTGQLSRHVLYQEHCLKRFGQRVIKGKRQTTAELINALTEFMLESEDKALIKCTRGRTVYVVRSASQCVYFLGSTTIIDDTVYHLFKTAYDEPRLTGTFKATAERLKVTTSTWADEHVILDDWERMPFIEPHKK